MVGKDGKERRQEKNKRRLFSFLKERVHFGAAEFFFFAGRRAFCPSISHVTFSGPGLGRRPPLSGGGLEASRSDPMLQSYKYVPQRIYRLPRSTPSWIFSLVFTLLLSFYELHQLAQFSHGVKVAASSKSASTNAVCVVIEPITPALSEAPIAIASSSITPIPDSFGYECPVDPPCSSLCQRSTKPPRWHTPDELGRRTRESSVGAIWY